MTLRKEPSISQPFALCLVPVNAALHLLHKLWALVLYNSIVHCPWYRSPNKFEPQSTTKRRSTPRGAVLLLGPSKTSPSRARWPDSSASRCPHPTCPREHHRFFISIKHPLDQREKLKPDPPLIQDTSSWLLDHHANPMCRSSSRSDVIAQTQPACLAVHEPWLQKKYQVSAASTNGILAQKFPCENLEIDRNKRRCTHHPDSNILSSDFWYS